MLEIEPPYHPAQLLPQLLQLATGSRRLLTGGTGLIRHLPHIDHAAIDLLGHHTLLLAGRGNLLVHALDAGNCLGDLPQRVTGLLDSSKQLTEQSVELSRKAGDLVCATVQAGDQLLDLFGRLLGALGQTSDLISDHREAAPRFTRAGGLDGGIERKQVGLL